MPEWLMIDVGTPAEVLDEFDTREAAESAAIMQVDHEGANEIIVALAMSKVSRRETTVTRLDGGG